MEFRVPSWQARSGGEEELGSSFGGVQEEYEVKPHLSPGSYFLPRLPPSAFPQGLGCGQVSAEQAVTDKTRKHTATRRSWGCPNRGTQTSRGR